MKLAASDEGVCVIMDEAPHIGVVAKFVQWCDLPAHGYYYFIVQYAEADRYLNMLHVRLGCDATHVWIDDPASEPDDVLLAEFHHAGLVLPNEPSARIPKPASVVT